MFPWGDAPGRAQGDRSVLKAGSPGRRSRRWPRRLSEGSRLRLMSLRCMVGNYARCNENNKAGSIAVSKNTANAECLPGAFVCHLWVFALRLAGRWEPCSAASRPSGDGFGFAGELRPLRLGGSASGVGAGVGVGGEAGASWVRLGCSVVITPCLQPCRESWWLCPPQPCSEPGSLTRGYSCVLVVCPDVPWQVPASWPARRQVGGDRDLGPGSAVCPSPAGACWGWGCRDFCLGLCFRSMS